MQNLKWRLLTIAALIALSGYALFPKMAEVSERQPDGTFRKTMARQSPIKLGLDLQGGMHLALEVDESRQTVANASDALDRAITVVRNRIDQMGVAEPLVQKVGDDRLIVELPGITDRARAEDVVKKAAFLRFQITDETGALDRVIPRLDGIVKEQRLTTGRATTAASDSQPSSALGNLLQSADTAGAADTAGTATDGPFRRLVTAGTMPGQYVVAAGDYETIRELLAHPAIQAALPPGKDVRWGRDSLALGTQVYRTLYVLDSRAIIDGTYLTDAKPNQDAIEGAKVDFVLNTEGGSKFRKETSRHIGDNMAVVLDDNVISAPVIQGAIGTRGQITMGGRDIKAANDLALVLRAGALPVPLKVVEGREIGPSLGQDSIDAGINAGIVAVVLVVLVMVVYYRFSGMLAVGALLLYVLFTMATLATFDAVLTLPGLAGFVLSIGIAVDANVLIFERIREELVHGRTVRSAIEEGFEHAMSAIIDSNVSTVLTAAVLYQYGSGPVRGFAVTLIAGIVASMVTAIFVTKTFYYVWLSRTRGEQALSI